MYIHSVHPGQVVSLPIGAVEGILAGVVLGNGYITDGEQTVRVPNMTDVSIIPDSDLPTKVYDVPTNMIFAGQGVTIGADPEIFAVGGDGEVIPAFEYLPGKKEGKVVTCPSSSNWPDPVGSAFYDGFQAEFTINSSGCHGYVTDYVRFGLQTVWNAARAHRPDATLSIDSALPISLETRMRVPREHLALGCAPSRNAYGESRLAVPAPEELGMRFAGSHMHFGGGEVVVVPDEIVTRTVKLLDAVVGVASVAMGEGFNCPARRQYYGRAGEYRFHQADTYLSKPSRLEYRVPDTVMLSHPATYNLMLDFTRTVWRMGMRGLGFLWHADEDAVRQAINEYDVRSARTILERNRRMLERILDKSNPNWGCTTEEWVGAGLKVFFDGIGSVVERPRDVVGNWWLDREYDPKVYNETSPTIPQDKWIKESYARKPSAWPTGRIWSSAAKIVMDGGRV